MRKILALALFFFTIIGCKNDTKKSEEMETVSVTQETEVHASATLEAEFEDPKVAEIYKQYNALKTTLVNTNSVDAATAASNLLTAYSNQGVEETVFKNAQIIVESTNIEDQRTAFVNVTADVEKLLEGALTSGTIYKQFCPMAFNNTGAYWLSNTKEIRNPYFGDVMLKCGRVAEEIK